MKFRLRHADKFVGVFFIIATAFIITALIIVGGNQRWFSRDYTFYTQFPTAAGISRNLSVQLSGFEIGKVIDYQLNDDNMVDVTFVIYDTYYDRVHPGSVVELKSNPLGIGGGLAFYPGINREQILEDFSFIPRINSPEGRQLVESGQVVLLGDIDPIAAILDQVEPILTGVQETVQTLNRTLASVEEMSVVVLASLKGEGEGPVTDTLQNIAAVTASVDIVLQSAQVILESVQLLAAELENPDGLLPRIVGAEGSIATFLNDDNQLFDSVFGSISAVEASLENVEEMTRSLQRTSPQIGVMLIEVQAAIEETRQVLEGVRNNPLLRGGIQAERAPSVHQPGYRNADF
ncbi:MlaD family protein [Spirochaeta dissipatitropha]